MCRRASDLGDTNRYMYFRARIRDVIERFNFRSVESFNRRRVERSILRSVGSFDRRSVEAFNHRSVDRRWCRATAATHFNAHLQTSRRETDGPQRRRGAAHRSIPLAIPGTLSHNRDEFENSEQRQRAGDAQALSNSEEGGTGGAAMMAISQTPRRQLACFDARFFSAAWSPHFRTRSSAHIARRCRTRASAKRHRYVRWRAYRRKKAREYFSCRLRTDKVFVYFTRLKMRVYQGANFLKRTHRKNDHDHGIQIHKDMHKTTSFLSSRLA